MVIKILILILSLAQSVKAEGEPKLTAQNKTKRAAPERISNRSFVFGSVAYYWWQEKVELKDASGTQHGLLTNTHGPCLGLGYFYRNPSWDFSLSACGFFGQSDISNTDQTINYSQRGVETYAAFAGPGISFRPDAKVSLGVSLPVYFRYADWTSPNASRTVEPKTRISGGLLLESQWRSHRIVVHQKIGPVLNVGWVFSLGVDYIF